MSDLAARLNLGEVVFHSIDLEPRIELGTTDTPILRDRLSIGEPIIFEISPDMVTEDELREYLRSERASSKYSLLDLVVNVRPGDGEVFSDLGVGVRLSGSDPSRPEPIAWSLSPMRLSTFVPVRRTVGLTVKAGLVEPKIEHQSEQTYQEDLVVAFGKRESNFEWHFKGDRQRPLVGAYQMQAVIKSPAGCDFQMQIVVAATVQRSRLNFRAHRYRAVLPPSVHIVLQSAHALPSNGERDQPTAL